MADSRPLSTQWEEMNTDRRAMLDRKREHSQTVMPHLLPWEGRTANTALDVPYSSTPAEGVNDLASRLTSLVLPLNGQPVFEIGDTRPFDIVDEDTSEVEDIWARFGRFVMRLLAPTNLRAQLQLLYQHLIVVGDNLLQLDPEFNVRLFRADQYVVRRKHEGDWVDIIIAEIVNPAFHEELKGFPAEKKQSASPASPGDEWEYLYTYIHKDPTTKAVTKRQEFRDLKVGEEETFKVSPYVPVRWGSIIGEAYGVSMIESNFGDMRGIDILAKGLLDGVTLGAMHRWGVNPAGITQLQDMLDGVNGDYVPATEADIFPMQFQNATQVAATHAALQHREQVINRKFLRRTPRQAERVTAQEILMDAQDLEGQLGDTLSMSGTEIQEPIIRYVLYQLAERGLIPPSISDEISKANGVVNLTITAGLAVLNREAEKEKLDGAIQRISNLPEAAQRAFNWPTLGRMWWRSMGLDAAGVVYTEEEMQQIAAQEAKAQAAQAAAIGSAEVNLEGRLAPGENNPNV